MDTYRFLLRLKEVEKAKLLKIQSQLSRRTGTQLSINSTIQILINKEKLNDDQEKQQ